MKHLEYGGNNDNLVFYFHGVPGAPHEIEIFEPFIEKNNLRLVSLDRLSLDRSIRGEDYFKAIAKEIGAISQGVAVQLVGFSIGCSVAIRVAPYLGAQLSRLLLISPAAPLDDGDFLKNMAGAPVFKLAQSRKKLFYTLSYFQRIISILSPSFLFHVLFSSAEAGDKRLRSNPSFQQLAKSLYRVCFQKRFIGYCREVILYSEPWCFDPNHGEYPVYIWHGSSDNWSPVEMAHFLGKQYGSRSNISIKPNLSHYSCLLETAQEVCIRCRVPV